MPSKKSYFSGRIFLRDLVRMWPVWAALLLVWVLSMPVSLENWNTTGLVGAEKSLMAFKRVLGVAVQGGGVIALLSGIVSAMCVFSYLYTSRSAVLFTSLPLRRESLFLSSYLAGLTGQLGVNLITIVATLVVALSNGYTEGLSVLLTAFGAMCAETIFFYSLACFCAMLTGQLLILPCVYGSINILCYVLESIASELIEDLLYGFRMGSGALVPLSPIVHLLNGGVLARNDYAVGSGDSITGIRLAGAGYLWALLAAGLALAVAALLIHRRRRVESASDVVALPVLKPVFRWCMGLGGGLVIGSILFFAAIPYTHRSEAFAGLLVCLLLGAFIGWFGSEMLMRKSFRVFRRVWRGFLLCAVVLSAGAALLRFDVFCIERRVPAADKVLSALTYCGGFEFGANMDTDIERVLELHRAVVADLDTQKRRDRSDEPKQYEAAFYLSVSYQLENGRMFSRSWNINCESKEEPLYRLAEALVNDPYRILREKALKEYPDMVLTGYVNVMDVNYDHIGSHKLGEREAERLYRECLLPDMREGLIGGGIPGRVEDITVTGRDGPVYVRILIDMTAYVDGKPVYESRSFNLVNEASRTYREFSARGYLQGEASDYTGVDTKAWG